MAELYYFYLLALMEAASPDLEKQDFFVVVFVNREYSGQQEPYSQKCPIFLLQKIKEYSEINGNVLFIVCSNVHYSFFEFISRTSRFVFELGAVIVYSRN
jgi:hypothetical protein